MEVEPARHRFTVTEYQQMGQAGIFGEDDRVELVDGEIIDMTPIGGRHAACVKRLIERFVLTFSDVALTDAQNSVCLSDDSEPQPDLALLHRRADYYSSGLPTPEDVFLLVDVAELSAEPDRRVKVPLYARNGIPELWLVDLGQETVTVYHDPTPNGYRTARVLRRGEQIAPAAFPDRLLAVSAILG